MLIIDNVAIPLPGKFTVFDFDMPLNYYRNYFRLASAAKGIKPKTFQGYLMTICKWLELNPTQTGEQQKDWLGAYLNHWGLSDLARRYEAKTEDIEWAERVDLMNALSKL